MEPGEIEEHSAARWATRRVYVLASLLWCCAALAIKPFYAYVDFGAFYATALDKIAAGAPLDLYAFSARAPGSDLAFPLTHPPIWFFFLAPWYALGRAIGLADFHRQTGLSLGQAWMLVASLPLDVLLCRLVVRLAEGSRRLPEPQRLVTFLCLLFSPLLWLSSVRFGHNESAMVLLVLLAVAAGEKRRPLLSGLLWGLGLGIKTTAAVPALIWFGWGLGRGRRHATLKCAAVAAAVFLAPLLPYLLLRREQVVYALIGFEKLRPLGGYVFWKLVPFASGVVPFANVLILASSLLLGLWLARRPGASFLASGGAWALVLGQILLLFLGKALFVWYALAASCFLFLAFLHDRRLTGTIPIGPLAGSLLLWILQSGPWVGESVEPAVILRSAVWSLFLLAVATIAVRGLAVESVRIADSRPR